MLSHIIAAYVNNGTLHHGQNVVYCQESLHNSKTKGKTVFGYSRGDGTFLAIVAGVTVGLAFLLGFIVAAIIFM